MRVKTKPATIYFDPALHKALRLKAAETEQSMSDMVNDVILILLAEDAEDLAAIDARKGKPTVTCDFVKYLKDRDRL